LRTTWGRIVWPSLRDQIAASYRMAKDAEAYAAMAAACRSHMSRWSSYQAVGARLDAALETLRRLPQDGRAAEQAGYAAIRACPTTLQMHESNVRQRRPCRTI
jgi:hypothetical protein